MNVLNLKVGEGFDVHALVDARPLIIGGVDIPHVKGLLGHSDADVLLHAITDALLGAAALGDIGQHFPDTDPRFKGADSKILLTKVVQLLKTHDYSVINVDCTVVAQAPKLMPHIKAMCEQIALCLSVPVDRVNVRAKTAEKLGPVGLEQSIEARAVVLLYKGPLT
jgi:2-C-methyl-D-erythritol 2,4-cyclodiphosphate synthase